MHITFTIHVSTIPVCVYIYICLIMSGDLYLCLLMSTSVISCRSLWVFFRCCVAGVDADGPPGALQYPQQELEPGATDNLGCRAELSATVDQTAGGSWGMG